MAWLRENFWEVLQWTVALVYAAKALLPGVGLKCWSREATRVNRTEYHDF